MNCSLPAIPRGVAAVSVAVAALLPAPGVRAADPPLPPAPLAAPGPMSPAAPTPPAGVVDAVFIDRVNEYPSLWQQDPRGDFKGDGAMYCVPAALSNGLMWLVEHGYPNLLPDPAMPRDGRQNRILAQIALLNAFTAPDFAPINGSAGASFGYMTPGVLKYVRSRGYQTERVLTVGVLVDGATAHGPAEMPLAAVKAALKDGAVVVLSVGRYKPSGAGSDRYKRSGGHAVTLVGWGRDAAGALDPEVLVVHDPSRPRVPTWPNSYLRVRPLTGGFFESRNGPPFPLAGRRYALFGMDWNENTDHITVLDAVLILKLRGIEGVRP